MGSEPDARKYMKLAIEAGTEAAKYVHPVNDAQLRNLLLRREPAFEQDWEEVCGPAEL